MAMADSSSATMEGSSAEEPRKSRKRKRAGSQAHGMKDKVALNGGTELLYFSVCRVVKRLNTLVMSSHDDSQGFEVEHLKATLQGPPEQIAEILGVSLMLANTLSRKTYSLIGDHIFIVDRCISTCIGFWKICSATADDPSDQPSNVRKKVTQMRTDAHYRSLGSIFSSLSIAYSSPSRNSARITRICPNKPINKQKLGGSCCPKDNNPSSSIIFQLEELFQY